MKKIALTALAVLAAAAPVAAQTPVSVPSFDSIQLRGGGRVTVRHGATQRVTLVRGSQEMTRFTVDREGQLRIDACVRSCRNYDLAVEIVTPDVDAVAIHGGGSIRTEGYFPDPGSFAVAISGGGQIDTRSIAPANVAAAINGGGTIRTNARRTLSVAINGGGSVTYDGRPQLTTAIQGGGTVHRAGGR